MQPLYSRGFPIVGHAIPQILRMNVRRSVPKFRYITIQRVLQRFQVIKFRSLPLSFILRMTDKFDKHFWDFIEIYLQPYISA